MKTESLRKLGVYDSKTLDDITELWWKEKTLFSILDPKTDFERWPLSRIHTVNYATISCRSDTQWGTLIEFLLGIDGVQAEFVFLEALCVNNQITDHSEKRMARSKVLEHSKEHHLVELSCLIDGEIWHDLSCIDKSKRPVVHSSTHETGLQRLVVKNLKEKGFDCAEFSGPGDRDAVRDAIETRWGTMENFNRRVQGTIVNVLELRQVCLYYSIFLSLFFFSLYVCTLLLLYTN